MKLIKRHLEATALDMETEATKRYEEPYITCD